MTDWANQTVRNEKSVLFNLNLTKQDFAVSLTKDKDHAIADQFCVNICVNKNKTNPQVVQDLDNLIRFMNISCI